MSYGGDEHEDGTLDDHPDDEGRERPRRAVPDPLDRLWLHPSELSTVAGAGFVGQSAAGAGRARPMWTTTLVAGAAGAILTLAVLGAVGALGRSSDHPVDHVAVPTSTPIATAQAVAIAVGHSVVAVSVRDKSGTRRGSGVCVKRGNEILTSDRLVGSSAKVAVTTANGVVHAARIVGRDATTDLVLLRLDAGVQAAPRAPHLPVTGDTAWVVGAPGPGDTSPWMSSGVVASTDSLVAFGTGPMTSGLLETGAASGTAAAGGALVDSTGHVMGIVLSPIGDSRVTYAVPIATALAVAADLRAHGHATHGTLGINGIDDAESGPTVTGLVVGGPAARAGMRVGDVLERVDRRQVDSMEDVMALVRHASPGQVIVVEVRRGNRTLRMAARLGGIVLN